MSFIPVAASLVMLFQPESQLPAPVAESSNASRRQVNRLACSPQVRCSWHPCSGFFQRGTNDPSVEAELEVLAATVTPSSQGTPSRRFPGLC
jgi:hypothetical protein